MRYEGGREGMKRVREMRMVGCEEMHFGEASRRNSPIMGKLGLYVSPFPRCSPGARLSQSFL